MGPLSGIKIIELLGMGPGPFCGMLLSDMGAEVISVERNGKAAQAERDDVVCMRGRRSIAVDLKHPKGIQIVLDLCKSADVLYEGFRPGVAERLGLGPEQCMGVNPALVYGRMTGWGQDGPLAQAAGHDINYISLSGALHAIGRKGDAPVPPLNLVGDYGGGGMLLALGIMGALLERTRSGKGQVIDASMVEGSALLMSVFYGLSALGRIGEERGGSMLGTAAPFYEVYETKAVPGKACEYVSVGSLEPQFYKLLLDKTGVDEADFLPQMNEAAWPQRKNLLAEVFRTKTRDEWCALLEGTDACFAPVLSISEAPSHPQNRARNSFVEIDGITQPSPAPKFSRTSPAKPGGARECGKDSRVVLLEMGINEREIRELGDEGIIGFGAAEKDK